MLIRTAFFCLSVTQSPCSGLFKASLRLCHQADAGHRFKTSTVTQEQVVGIFWHLNPTICQLSVVSCRTFTDLIITFDILQDYFFFIVIKTSTHSQATCRATAFTASWGGTLWHAFQSSQLMEKTGESKTKLPKHCSVDWGKYHYVGSGCHVKTINNHNLKLPSAMNHSRSNRSCLSPLKISLDP